MLKNCCVCEDKFKPKNGLSENRHMCENCIKVLCPYLTKDYIKKWNDEK